MSKKYLALGLGLVVVGLVSALSFNTGFFQGNLRGSENPLYQPEEPGPFSSEIVSSAQGNYGFIQGLTGLNRNRLWLDRWFQDIPRSAPIPKEMDTGQELKYTTSDSSEYSRLVVKDKYGEPRYVQEFTNSNGKNGTPGVFEWDFYRCAEYDVAETPYGPYDLSYTKTRNYNNECDLGTYFAELEYAHELSNGEIEIVKHIQEFYIAEVPLSVVKPESLSVYPLDFDVNDKLTKKRTHNYEFTKSIKIDVQTGLIEGDDPKFVLGSAIGDVKFIDLYLDSDKSNENNHQLINTYGRDLLIPNGTHNYMLEIGDFSHLCLNIDCSLDEMYLNFEFVVIGEGSFSVRVPVELTNVPGYDLNAEFEGMANNKFKKIRGAKVSDMYDFGFDYERARQVKYKAFEFKDDLKVRYNNSNPTESKLVNIGPGRPTHFALVLNRVSQNKSDDYSELLDSGTILDNEIGDALIYQIFDEHFSNYCGSDDKTCTKFDYVIDFIIAADNPVRQNLYRIPLEIDDKKSNPNAGQEYIECSLSFALQSGKPYVKITADSNYGSVDKLDVNANFYNILDPASTAFDFVDAVKAVPFSNTYELNSSSLMNGRNVFELKVSDPSSRSGIAPCYSREVVDVDFGYDAASSEPVEKNDYVTSCNLVVKSNSKKLGVRITSNSDNPNHAVLGVNAVVLDNSGSVIGNLVDTVVGLPYKNDVFKNISALGGGTYTVKLNMYNPQIPSESVCTSTKQFNLKK